MIRVAIAATSDVARAGIASVVAGLDGVEIAGVASDPDALLRVVRTAAPDVVIVDAGGRGDDLIPFASVLGDAPRGPGVVVLTDAVPDVAPGDGLRRTDGWALMPRRSAAAEMDAAIRGAAARLVVTHPILLDRSASAQPAARIASESSVLTPREIEVLQMLAAGLPNKTIAKRLGVSAHTVKFHVGSIMAKLHASSRTEAVTDGIRRGLIFV